MILQVQQMTKIYHGGVLANDGVNFDVKKGEIHALVGENGAGKSTLMKVLCGLEQPTAGTVLLEGNSVHFGSSREAIDHGIGMVHQHFMLVDSFTAAENLMLGRPDGSPVVNKKGDTAYLETMAKQYNFDIDSTKKVRDMSVGMKQKLEILKILCRQAKIIILDEPTAVLTPQECDELFERLVELRDSGLTIIFISHKLGEVKRISDRITVLKSGRTIGTYNNQEVSQEELSRLMVGQVISTEYAKEGAAAETVLLETKNLQYMDAFYVPRLCDVSLRVHAHEIVGIAGVDDNGQAELVRIIAAELKADKGSVLFDGVDITHASIGEIRKRGLAYIPEDRMTHGCAPEMSVEENLLTTTVDEFSSKLGLIDQKKVDANTQKMVEEFHIKTSHGGQIIKRLSGGNIQKAIIAREFSQAGSMLLLSQPTRGVDVGAIHFIHEKILEMRTQGFGILLVSAELTELLSLSDRILVMHKGRIVAALDNTKGTISEEELGLYMLGVREQAPAELQQHL